MTITKLSNNALPSVPSIFDRFFDGDLMDWSRLNYSGVNTTLPAVNVVENEDAYHIEVAAPGLKKEDFRIDYDNCHLVISSEKEEEKEVAEDKKLTLRHEFCYHSFKRTFTIAEKVVDAEKISASYEDGILHINLPKREEVKPKPSKQILIS